MRNSPAGPHARNFQPPQGKFPRPPKNRTRKNLRSQNFSSHQKFCARKFYAPQVNARAHSPAPRTTPRTSGHFGTGAPRAGPESRRSSGSLPAGGRWERDGKRDLLSASLPASGSRSPRAAGIPRPPTPLAPPLPVRIAARERDGDVGRASAPNNNPCSAPWPHSHSMPPCLRIRCNCATRPGSHETPPAGAPLPAPPDTQGEAPAPYKAARPAISYQREDCILLTSNPANFE